MAATLLSESVIIEQKRNLLEPRSSVVSL